MWIVIASCLIVWFTAKRTMPGVRFPAVLLISLVASGATFSAVQYSGITRTTIAPEQDLVVYNEIATFPFTIQKLHNWSAHKFIYQILLGGSDGTIIHESASRDDQSEFMHWEQAVSVGIVCILGIIMTIGTILPIEFFFLIKSKKTYANRAIPIQTP